MQSAFDLSRTVLARADAAAIRTEPFPHLVIENALDRDHLAALMAVKPHYRDIGGKPPYLSFNRLPYSARLMLQLRFVDPLWLDFVETHSNKAITLAVADLFRDHWPGHLPDLGWLADPRYGLLEREAFDQADVLTDSRLELNSPVLEKPSSHRRGHLDLPNRIFSCLFYLRAPDDDAVGGDLVLYRWRDARAEKLAAFELPPETIEPVVTVPYAANTLVLFPNSPDAIHGVSDRHPTPHERSYVFITAEVEQELF